MKFYLAVSSQFPSPYNVQFRSKFAHYQHAPIQTERTRSILVVDDAPDIALMLKFFLEKAGYRVVTVFSALEALDTAEHEHFDAIVSDIGLPVMDGYELVRTLRALREYVSTPIIAVTGFAEYSDQQSAFNAGFDAHLIKPIDPTRLVELLGTLER